MRSRRSAFTLIELLVVIAIIAILAVVVVLTINPAELLKQARDSNRLSDMSTLQNALNIYSVDQSGVKGYSMGTASATAISVYDPNGSTTCGSLGLAGWSGGQTWQCSTQSAYRQVNGGGWLPVDIASTTSGSPIGSLPVDPTNQTSSGLFYTYGNNGTQYALTADLESAKYKTQLGSSSVTVYFPNVVIDGTPSVSALYNSTGLAGYWPLDEGTGTIAYDKSGNGKNGTWYNYGAPGASPYDYVPGKVGPYAGNFNVNTSTYLVTSFNNTSQSAFTVSVWVEPLWCGATDCYIVVESGSWTLEITSTNFYFSAGGGGVYTPYTANTWQLLTGVYTGSAVYLYVDGNYVSGASASALSGGSNLNIGAADPFHYISGYLDDVRVYNRALSSAEIQALYNSQK